MAGVEDYKDQIMMTNDYAQLQKISNKIQKEFNEARTRIHYQWVFDHEENAYPQFSRKYLNINADLEVLPLSSDKFKGALSPHYEGELNIYGISLSESHYEHFALIAFKFLEGNQLNIYYLDGMGAPFKNQLIETIETLTVQYKKVRFYYFSEQRQYAPGLCGAYTIYDLENLESSIQELENNGIIVEKDGRDSRIDEYRIGPQLPFFSWCQSCTEYERFFGESSEKNKGAPLKDALLQVLDFLQENGY